MAIGDEAAAEGMALVPGSTLRKDVDTEINRSRDYIAQARAYARSLVAAISLTWGSITDKPTHYASRSDIVTRPGISGTVENALNDIFGLAQAALSRAGGTLTGHLFSPPARSTPVTTGYVAAYLNNDGRLGATPSAAKFKKNVKPKTYTLEDAARLGALVVTYQLRAALFPADDPARNDAPTEHGVIAEALITAGFPEFVVFDGNGEPFSVQYERLVLVIAGAMPEVMDRISALEARP